MNKEQVYDDQISPLIKQIVDIARQNGIAMVASFSIAHDGEGPNGEDCSTLTCTTHLPDGDDVFDPRYKRCAQAIQQGHHQMVAMSITSTAPDGSKTLTAII
ncbi:MULTISPECIES: hypothetical protein [Pseudomonas syringae group]|uniref:Uncharacterized protein n=1 Tax=Pseudomonas syringae pv. tagetis TaxID=129140 RepID=A0A0Q0CVK1_9PSED|nr:MULTISPECIES: hypothetical protein [Pseudomonas syringae group]KPY88961.1 Uncharacterized protein ALO44_00265 [Pseudomonas syringae pv. tagetis]MCF5652679.1 hypothetical protein [Pseudomonas syringae]QVI77383.1 hypothetical protein KHW13_10040 [Pseudomonas syringae]RMW13659.1 hypothetical protein ALO98_02093 [Pseudomonas syringae pv. tagetis]RMW23666.1 hypothetical protein ALO97_03392 [Pseudomonas syringae pv. tagetis]